MNIHQQAGSEQVSSPGGFSAQGFRVFQGLFSRGFVSPCLQMTLLSGWASCVASAASFSTIGYGTFTNLGRDIML